MVVSMIDERSANTGQHILLLISKGYFNYLMKTAQNLHRAL